MKKEIKLIYKNHNTVDTPVWNKVEGAQLELNKTSGITIHLEEIASSSSYFWSEAEIVLVHDHEMWKFIDNEEKNLESNSAPKRWSVIITFSSQGVKHFPKRHDFKKNDIDYKFYSFGIYPPQQTSLSVEEWKEVLLFAAELSGEDKTIEQVTNSIPKEIKHILCPPQSRNNLIALSILCQGYLAVCYDKFKDDNSCTEYRKIETALEQMGWTDFMNKGAGKSLIKENLGDKLSEVQKTNWWHKKVFTDDNNYSSIKWDELRNEIANECKKGNFAKVDGDIRKLFDDIATENKEIGPSTVAKAYCAIAKVFANTTLSA